MALQILQVAVLMLILHNVSNDNGTAVIIAILLFGVSIVLAIKQAIWAMPRVKDVLWPD